MKAITDDHVLKLERDADGVESRVFFRRLPGESGNGASSSTPPMRAVFRRVASALRARMAIGMSWLRSRPSEFHVMVLMLLLLGIFGIILATGPSGVGRGGR